jgi:phenylalanyl-tRNA synthetase beta chain
LNHGERNIKLFELGKVYLKKGATHTEPFQLSIIFSGQNNEEHWQVKAAPISPAYIKGMFEEMLKLLRIEEFSLTPCNLPFIVGSESSVYTVGNNELGYYGKLSAAVGESFGIDLIELKQDIWIVQFEVETLIELTRGKNMVFSPIPRFPAVNRDLSFVIANSVSYREIENCIRSMDSELISELKAFDEYRGKQIPEGFRSLSLHIKFQDKEKTLTDERIDQMIDLVKKKLQDTWQITMR